MAQWDSSPDSESSLLHGHLVMAPPPQAPGHLHLPPQSTGPRTPLPGPIIHGTQDTSTCPPTPWGLLHPSPRPGRPANTFWPIFQRDRSTDLLEALECPTASPDSPLGLLMQSQDGVGGSMLPGDHGGLVWSTQAPIPETISGITKAWWMGQLALPICLLTTAKNPAATRTPHCPSQPSGHPWTPRCPLPQPGDPQTLHCLLPKLENPRPSH